MSDEGLAVSNPLKSSRSWPPREVRSWLSKAAVGLLVGAGASGGYMGYRGTASTDNNGAKLDQALYQLQRIQANQERNREDFKELRAQTAKSEEANRALHARLESESQEHRLRLEAIERATRIKWRPRDED